MPVELVVLDTPQEAVARAATLLADAARRGASIVLAGGSTPRDAYVLAAELEPDWGDATLWLGDERAVPPGDPRTNARLVRESLLDRLAVSPRVHLVDTALPAAAAAEAYDRELRRVRLDLALLGIGPDGHTASLFPDAPSLAERERLAVAAEPGLEPWVSRVTLTIPALASAQHVAFLAVGAAKAAAVRRAFAEDPSPATPASLVRSKRGVTTAILDREAGSLLG